MDKQKTKAQLLIENEKLRRQNNQLKKLSENTTDKKWLSDNSDKLNRAIIDKSPLGISVRSAKGKLLSVNESWKKIWNLSDKQVEKLKAANPKKPNFVHTRQSLGEWLPKVENIYQRGGYLNIPKLFLLDKETNRSCWVSLTYYAIKDDKDEVERVVILTDDLTERIDLERGAQELHSKYRSVIDNANIGILIIQDNQLVFCNSRIHEMFGYTLQNFNSIGFLSIIHPDDRPIVIERIKARLSGAGKELKPLEIRAVCNSGEEKWIEANSTKIQWKNKPAIQAFISDITERKQAEKALWESKEKYKSLITSITDMIFVVSKDGEVISANESAAKSFRKVPDEIKGQKISNLFPPKISNNYLRNIKKIIKAGEAGSFESISVFDKSEVWLSTSLSPLKDSEGKTIAVIGVSKDITERKLAEENLQRYKCIVSNSNDMLALIDKNFVYLAANEKYIKAFGLTHNELIGSKVSKILGSKIFKSTIQPNAKKCLQGHDVRYREWIDFPAYGKRYMEISYDPYRGPDNKIAGFVVNSRDITENKRAEKALHESNEKYKLLVESLNSSIVNYAPDGTIIYCSPNVKELGGYNSEEEIGQHFTKYIADKADLIKLQEIFKKILISQKSETFEFLYRPKNREPFYVEAKANPVFKNGSNTLESISCIVSDITERKQSEEAIRNSEAHYRHIFNNALLGIFRAKISDGKILEINSKAAELLGLPAEEIIGKMHTSDLYQNPELRKDYVAKLKENGEIYGVEIDMVLPDNRKVTFLFSVKAYPEQDYLEGVVVDITRRKQVEEERRKLEAAVKHSSELINLATLEGNMIFLNEAGGKMLGIDPEDVHNTNIMEIIPEHKIELVQNELLPALMSGEHWNGDLQYQNLKTGKLTDVHATAFTVNDPKTNKPQFLANVSLDITETKRLREQESRAQRLESAGRVAGQIAHDFNNLLAPLVAYPDFIKDELPDNHPALKYINDMEKSANKIAEINQQLLTLSRRGHYNQEILNLNELIRIAIGEIGLLPQTLVIETDFADNLMNIMGGEAQISRVLSNLIHNARDAMHDIGNITIKTENYYADNLKINYGQIPKGEYVKVTISDIGSGIPEDIRSQMFDPFFSTKTSDQRRGSGLGLSVVDAVMKDHNGIIDLQSTVGEGTSFYLYFPITRENLETTIEDAIIGGTESILVVDDDMTQCQVALKLLEKLGYNATAVNSGEKAIEYLKKNPRDLVILDMIMPDGIDGTDTFQQILEFNPEQKAIIVSGYAESSRIEKARQLGIDMYIRKPLNLKLIASCIRKTLDKKEIAVGAF